MANVLNRVTKQFIASVNTPDYPIANWIINPDLSAVQGQPVKYWVINGDTVTLADAATQAAIDAAAVSAARDATAAQFDFVEGIIRALALVTLDEINILRTNASLAPRTAAQMRTAIRNKLGS